MGKIKLPKSLLKVLFPKKKKSKGGDNDLFYPTQQQNSSALAVIADNSNDDLDKQNENGAGGVHESTLQVKTISSSSPTLALSYSNEDAVNIVSVELDFDEEEHVALQEDVSDEQLDVVRDVPSACSEGSTGKVLTDLDSAKPEEVQEKTDEVVEVADLKVQAAEEDNSDDLLPSLPTTPEPLPLHTTPAAIRAREKALARQKRILSQCEERLNALTGTAEATLSPNSVNNNVKIKRQQKQKPKKLNVDSQDKKLNLDKMDNQEGKQFSSIVFYESHPDGDIEGTSDKKPSLPPPVKDSPPRKRRPKSITVDQDPTNESAIIDPQGFPIPTPPQSSTPITFFILLLDPKSRIFELIQISDADPSSTVKDVLNLIPTKCTDERLLNMDYVGLCRPVDCVEFVELGARAFVADITTSSSAATGATVTGEGVASNYTTSSDATSANCIMENDMLVAILADYTGFQMCKISKPILKNGKFRDMIRRRRVVTKKPARVKPPIVEMIDDTDPTTVGTQQVAVPTVIEAPRVNERKQEDKKEKYKTLCTKLESLSKKLHTVDEEIMAGQVRILQDDSSAIIPASSNEQEGSTNNEVAYRMTPRMVANELAHHIEDIFADHDVEILAVDADDDSDDGTFVSARSQKSVRSLMAKAAAANKKKGRRERKSTSLFESNDDNALAAQIEAMAVQAEEAFGNRRGRKSLADSAAAAVDKEEDDVYEVPEVEEDAVVIPEEFESCDILDTMKSLTRGSAAMDVSNCTAEQKEAFSRNFLNTSTSMVSTMVAASHGRVNEMHVLQYLGCTIVCIAANFAQQRKEKQQEPISPNFGARQIFQSAMFLAFMVNGQRYLAKVTKK